MKPSSRFKFVLTGVTVLINCSIGAQAQVITKADNTSALTNALSYVSGGPPNVAGTNTILIDGTFTASRTSALGGNISIAGINQDSTADFQFQIGNTPGAVLTIGSGGVTKSSTIIGAGLILANAVTLGANQTWTITGGGSGNNLQMNGAFSDGGKTLAVIGTGTFDLRGTNTFGSNVTIDTTVSVNSAGATVTFGGANTMNSLSIPSGRVIGATLNNFGVASNFGDGGTNTAITLGNTTRGVMEYSGITASSNRTVNRDARSVGSGIDVTTSGQTLTLSGNMGSGSQINVGNNGWAFGGAGNLTLNGVISNSTGVGSTGTTITKNDGGTLTLGNASNTYTGVTDVVGGKLIVNGNISTSSLTTVKTGATLGGTGTVGAVVVDSNGIFAPGDSGIESLNVNGNLTLNSGSISNFEINTAGDIADLAISSALLTFGGTLNVTRVGGALVAGDTFNLFDWSSATGTFSTVNLPSLDTGLVWDQSSLYSNGQISIAAIPEPGAALLGGIGVLALLRRRRA
jgi:fibronectin-binding autotransporter adhesin